MTSSSQVFYVNVVPSSSNSNQTNTNQNSTTTTTPQMTVTTDQTSYNQGDTIHISGSVNPVESNTAIAVLVRDPLSNLVSEAQSPLSSSGSFSVTLKANGPLWKQAGTYTVIALYGKVANTTTTFSFSGGNGQIIANPPVISDAFQINTGGQTYNVPYVIKGGTVKSMDVYSDKLMLEVTIAATSDGSFTTTLPRGLIDAKDNGTDNNFIIMVNDTPVQFTETKDTNSRTLSIPFHASDTKIDIIGTQIAGNSVTPTPQPTPQPAMLSVMTDKTYYVTGDRITISGTADPNLTMNVTLQGIPNPIYKKVPVTIQTFDSANNLVSVDQIDVNDNGMFTSIVTTTEPLWKYPGLYTITVQQGPDHKVTTNFWFNYNGGPLPNQQKTIASPSSTPVAAQPTQIAPPPTIPTTILNATPQEITSINEARNNQTIAAEVNVANQTVQTTSINSNVSVQTNNTSPDSLSISVSAPSQTSPKVIVVNIVATTIDIANLKDLGVMYDGAPIPPASNIDSILHAKSTDNPSFAIVITQSGAQILILIPHFSTHTITITNMTKVIPAVPEFGSLAGMIIVISIIGVLTISRKFRFHF